MTDKYSDIKTNRAITARRDEPYIFYALIIRTKSLQQCLAE